MKYLIIWLAVMSVVLFILMGVDKSKAKRHAWRIKERTLILLAAVGGAIGGCLGMLLFRHKTKHAAFVITFPLFAVLHLVALWLLAK